MNKSNKEMVQAVSLVLVETAAMVIVIRLLSRPDTVTQLRMKLFKSLENTCQSNAEFWALTANVSRKAYESSRSTTV